MREERISRPPRKVLVDTGRTSIAQHDRELIPVEVLARVPPPSANASNLDPVVRIEEDELSRLEDLTEIGEIGLALVPVIGQDI
jgi:hypothetical protein